MDWDPENWVVDPATMFDLTGKTAIVMGGASGLGRAIALGVAEFGANVAVLDVDEEGTQEVAAYIGDAAIGVTADVTDADSLQAAREEILDTFGDYEILYNIPGINVRKPVLELTEEEWRDVIELNLTGVFLSSKVLGAHLVERDGGSVINMSSGRALRTGPAQAPYSVSKGGVVLFTKVLAAEWAPDVRVNALAPGYTTTPLVRQAMDNTEWYESMRDQHALERFGKPEEQVGIAVFLASEASAYATGAIFSVDGGWAL